MKHIFPKKVHWRDECIDDVGLLEGLFDEHKKWTHEITKQFAEIPLGYTEWTLTGQLAIAADRLGYYAVQEYFIESRDKSEASKKYRPDLYIETNKDGPTYVFEVKKCGIDLDNDSQRIKSKLKKELAVALNRLYRYHREARYRCSLIAAFIWVGADQWSSKYSKKSSYERSITTLRRELQKTLERLPRSMANFCAGFVCSYNEAVEEGGRGQSPFPLGVVYIGRLKPPVTRGQ